MRVPEEFRYSSLIEDFETAVDILAEELEKKKAFLLYGCIRDIYIELSNELNSTMPEMARIINVEVISLLEEALKDTFELESLNDYLEEQCEEENITYEDKEEILEIYEQKYNYVLDKLVNEEMFSRYYFKDHTINQKFGNIRVDINKFVINDMKDLKYALIEMVSNDNVPAFGIPNELNKLIEKKDERIKFVCDINDIEYLINCLENIKQRLAE